MLREIGPSGADTVRTSWFPAPIFNRQEEVLGSLMLAISLHDPAFDGFAALAPRVMEAAREISRRIALMDDAAALPARAVG